MKNNCKHKNGFTLIELMIVVAIIGLLAAIAVPKFANMVNKAQEASTKGYLGAVRSALMISYADSEGVFPVYEDGNGGANLFQTLSNYLQGSTPRAITPGTTSDCAQSSALQQIVYAGDPRLDIGDLNRGWFYDGANELSGNIPTNPRSTWGVFVVNCLEEDLKGVVWSTH